MKNNRKIIFAFCFFVFCFLHITTQAQVASGDCGANGNNLTWILTEDSTLTISGNGAMGGYTLSAFPWYPYRSQIKAVVIDNGVTTIGNYAFLSYSQLTSVSIGNSLATIGNWCFGGCAQLATINIPGSMTFIGQSAFAGCTQLTTINIPNLVTTIGNDAFFNCTKLASINVDITNLNYSSVDGILYNKLQDVLIQCPAGKSGAANISNATTTINDDAFAYCSQLTSVNIPGLVTTIGSDAFNYCINLRTIYCKAKTPPSISQYTFSDVPTDALVSVPCSSLSNYQRTPYWNSFTNIIGESIRGTCGLGLTWELCDSVLTVSGNGAMDDYASTNFPWYANKNMIKTAIISNGVTKIGNFAFFDCLQLSSVSIGNSVKTIGKNTFLVCPLLTSIDVSSANPDYSSINGVLYNKLQSTIIQCPGGKKGTVNIPSSVKTIGDNAFSFCIQLTSVNIPKSVTTIGNEAFNYCTTLETILCRANIPPAVFNQYTTFVSVPATVHVYVPCGSAPAYQTTWGHFADYIEDENKIDAPFFLSVAQVEGSFSITWENSTTLYKLYRNDELLATLNTNTYTDSDLIYNTTYYYQIQAINGNCESELSGEFFHTFDYTGIAETRRTSSLRVYPNPTTGELRIEAPGNEISDIEIFDVMGKKMSQLVTAERFSILSNQIDISHLPNGTYFLRINGETVKVVLQR